MSLIKDGTAEPSKGFSFVVSGAAMGSILASLTLYLLEKNFTQPEILEFAWRLPFILGSILCLIGILMRTKLPDFPQTKIKDLNAWFILILPCCKDMISSVMVISLPAYLIVMNLFFPSFLPKFYGHSTQSVYLAISISLIWAVIFAPIFAYITNKMSKSTLLQIIIVATIFLGLIINFLLLRQSLNHLIIALCIYQSIISSLMVVIFPLMAEIFPAGTRFTMIAICYNITYSVMSFAPVLITNLAIKWQTPISLWVGLIILSILTLANIGNLNKEE